MRSGLSFPVKRLQFPWPSFLGSTVSLLSSASVQLMAGMWANEPSTLQGWRSEEAREEGRRLQRLMMQNIEEDRRATGWGGQAPSVTMGWDAPAIPLQRYALGGGWGDGVTEVGGRKRGRDGSDSDWGPVGGGGGHGGGSMACVGWQAPSLPMGWQPPFMPVRWQAPSMPAPRQAPGQWLGAPSVPVKPSHSSYRPRRVQGSGGYKFSILAERREPPRGGSSSSPRSRQPAPPVPPAPTSLQSISDGDPN